MKFTKDIMSVKFPTLHSNYVAACHFHRHKFLFLRQLFTTIYTLTLSTEREKKLKKANDKWMSLSVCLGLRDV